MIQGWGSDSPLFKRIIDEIKPKVIVEVGSWKGASAVHMANLCDAEIYCVDTWLGDVVNWIRMEEGIHPGTHLKLNDKGFPTVYEEFWNNTKDYKQIHPLIMVSWQGAKFLAYKQIFPDLIYIDASHHYDDVKRDAYAYWHILHDGGVMIFDDYINLAWKGVRQAVDEFMAEKKISGRCIDDKMVIIR